LNKAFFVIGGALIQFYPQFSFWSLNVSYWDFIGLGYAHLPKKQEEATEE
jgi:hypothetical protein